MFSVKHDNPSQPLPLGSSFFLTNKQQFFWGKSILQQQQITGELRWFYIAHLCTINVMQTRAEQSVLKIFGKRVKH